MLYSLSLASLMEQSIRILRFQAVTDITIQLLQIYRMEVLCPQTKQADPLFLVPFVMGKLSK